MIERLKAGLEDPYDPIEASIHVGRYAMALPFASGRRVLDIACGEGYGSWLLADAGASEVVGVDISAEAIAKARANFPHERLRFEEGAGESLSERLPQGHFDLIVCIETIEHVADVEAFLRDLRAVAAPGAIFVITCPNDHWYYRDGGTNPYHVRRLTLDEFKALTVPVLGERVEWLIGSATLGFGACAMEADAAADPARPKVVSAAPSLLSLRVPSNGATGPSPANCSYFIGVWNAPRSMDGVGAHHAISMDRYGEMMWTSARPEQFAALQADAAALRAERDAERREKELTGIQAAVLRRENEILSARIRELQHALDRKLAGFPILGAPSRRLRVRRALGRIVRASPFLSRLVVRLRRIRAGG